MQMQIKKIPLDKINVTKMHFFLLASSDSSQFYLQFVIFMKAEAQVRLSKTVCEIFHFRFRLVFTKIEVFV